MRDVPLAVLPIVLWVAVPPGHCDAWVPSEALLDGVGVQRQLVIEGVHWKKGEYGECEIEGVDARS
ncbi:hypothetical protein [Methanopyrus sp.]